MMNRALYLKYASSQNYYYTKDLNDFLDDAHKNSVINFKDQVLYEEKNEYMV